VTISDRDRRILLILLPVVVLLAYWFLILSPKRSDLKAAQDRQTAAEQERDAAVALAAQLEKARASFATDYAAVVRLGKAIPATIDSPSLLVQLDRAADGTHIDLSTVTFGERGPATTTTTTTTTGATGTSGPQPQGNAAAGGAPAQTQPGQQVEAAGNAANQANQANAAATDTNVTTTAGAAPPAPAAPAALDQVAVTFNFSGSYFDLADFFHRMKRFVYVANNQIFVRGRLISIDTLVFQRGGTPGAATSGAGDLTATVGATVYLSPKGQGVTGGATPQGPSGTTTQTTTAPAGSQTSRVPLATVGAR
jgi:hypothetical protein